MVVKIAENESNRYQVCEKLSTYLGNYKECEQILHFKDRKRFVPTFDNGPDIYRWIMPYYYKAV